MSIADGAGDDALPQRWPPLPPPPPAAPPEFGAPHICCVEAILSAGDRHTPECSSSGAPR